MRRSGFVKRLDERFRSQSGLVNGPIVEIRLLLGVIHSPRRLARRAAMTGVGGRSRITAIQRFTETIVVDRTAVAPIARAEVAPVPTGGGKPYFNADLRIGRWPRHRLDTTE